MERILEEFRAINAYVRTWQSSGAYPLAPTQAVQEMLEDRVTKVIKPWPTIDLRWSLSKEPPTGFPYGAR